ncbi:hypothetical protein IWQ61_010344, partial [Dispira simplex]
STPENSFYTLIWHPGTPEYTLTSVMAFLTRAYDSSAIFPIPALNSAKETANRFAKGLSSPTANICNLSSNVGQTVAWTVART